MLLSRYWVIINLLWKHCPHQQERCSGHLQENLCLVRKLQHFNVVTAVHCNTPAHKAARVKTHNSWETYIFYNFLIVKTLMNKTLEREMYWLLKQQRLDAPVGTTVNVGPGRDLATWLATDEYVDILDSVHLAGILQDKGIWTRARHT